MARSRHRQQHVGMGELMVITFGGSPASILFRLDSKGKQIPWTVEDRDRVQELFDPRPPKASDGTGDAT